jgi:hypothetical protein
MADIYTPYTANLIFGSAALGGNTLILNQWSPDVLRYGRDMLVFSRFLETRTELGRGKGDSIIVPIIGEMTSLGTSALAEGSHIPIGTQDQDSFSVTVTEYGRGLARPNTLDYFSNIDLQNQMKMSLGWNYAKTWDEFVKSTVFDGGAHGFRTVAAGGSYTYGSNLTSQLGVGTLTDDLIDAVFDKLKQNKVPTFPDGLYRWITNNRGARDAKRLENFEKLNIYSNFVPPQGITMQVIGRYKGFEFIETEENMGTNKIGYAFGRSIGVQAFALPMQVRYTPDYGNDFGRAQAFAWYTIAGAAKALADKGTHLLVIRHGTGA